MTRIVNAAGEALLMEFEQGPHGGPALTVYLCPAGKPTIAWGHVVGRDQLNLEISVDQAGELLRQDMAIAALEVETHVAHDLSDNQFAALACFAFNVPRIGFETSTLLKDLAAGDLVDVPAQLMRWDKMHDPKTGAIVEVAGLKRRRAAEVTLWNTPD